MIKDPMPQSERSSLAETLKYALSKPLGAGGDLRLTAALCGTLTLQRRNRAGRK